MTMAWAIRNLLRLSPDESQSNGSDSQSQGQQGEQQNGDDGDDELDGMSNEALLNALRTERAARKTADGENRTLRREKADRDKSDADAAAEIARKNGEWEKIAQDAEKERDREKAAREALEKSIIADRKKNAVLFEAQKLSFHDPEEAVKLIDMDAIELDDDDQPKGVPVLVKRLADAKKYLLKQGTSGDGMPQTPSRQGDNQQYSASRSYIAATYGKAARNN